MNFYYCDACHYCFESESLPDRCPDCGAVEHDENPAVRLATKYEIEELLRIRAEDNDCLTAPLCAISHSEAFFYLWYFLTSFTISSSIKISDILQSSAIQILRRTESCAFSISRTPCS